MEKLLTKIRLTNIFLVLLVFFATIVFFLPQIEYNRAILTIFSVNSFLYGFYISPIIRGQKARIDSLQKSIRSEANVIFKLALQSTDLKDKQRNELQEKLKAYLQASYDERGVAEGEDEYEILITHVLEERKKKGAPDVYNEILKNLIDNQSNRSQLAMDFKSKVFRHEWIVMSVLFFITVTFVLIVDAEGNVGVQLIKSFLAAGLSMLMIILGKYSTLTHKQAKGLWEPYKKLIKSNFYRID